jgi:hypothetical protein
MWETAEKINGIEIYSVSPEALKVFKDNAKNANNSTNDAIQRRLTALVLNAQDKRPIVKNKYAIVFGQFKMIVNEFTKHIEVLFWDKDYNHYATKQEGINLRETYKKLGLNNNGNKIIKS